MLKFLTERYTVFLPEVWASGLDFGLYGRWVHGTFITIALPLAIVWFLLDQIRFGSKKKKPSYVMTMQGILPAIAILDGLAPLAIPGAVIAFIAFGVWRMFRAWRSSSSSPS